MELSDIITTVKQFVDNNNKSESKSIDKINRYLDDLEKCVNSTNKSSQLIEQQTKTLEKNINDSLKSLNKKHNDFRNNLIDWYEKQALQLKIRKVISSNAKLGIELTKEEAEPIAKSMPHPSIESFISEINFEVDLSGIASTNNQIILPRL